MPEDPNITIIQDLLAQLAADDAVEDAAYEATITNLETQTTSLVAERDGLVAEQAGNLAQLVEARTVIADTLASLDARIALLDQ